VALGALAGSALAVAISLTLFRGGGRPGSLARLGSCVATDPRVLSGDGLANLALFAPAAFLAVLAIGRPGGVTAAITAVSLAVEGLQAVRSLGVCDSSDALLNSLGGLAAALAAALVRSAFTRGRPLAHDSVPGSDPCRRSC
jgi:glycopeptide antibiotics resistance protein